MSPSDKIAWTWYQPVLQVSCGCFLLSLAVLLKLFSWYCLFSVVCSVLLEQTSCWRAAATICRAQACKWWHDIHHVRIWIGHHYCMSMLLASTTNQSDLVTLTFDLLTLKVVSESRVTWATSVPILDFLGLSVLELSRMYATDRQTDRCQSQTSDKNIA